MKAKVKYRKYGDIPDMDTVKDIIIYGAKQGKHNKQYAFKNMNANTVRRPSTKFFMTQRDLVSIFTPLV